MKKIYLSFFLAFLGLSLSLVSCDPKDDDNQKAYSGDAKLFFAQGTESVALEFGAGDVILDVDYLLTSPSPSTTTVSLSVDAANSTAVEGVDFEILSADDIQEGELGGTIQVRFVGNASVSKTATFNLTSPALTNAIFKDVLVVTTVITCPVPATSFVGDYLIQELTPYVDGPTFNDNSVVTLVYVNSTRRQFVTSNYPNYCPSLNTANPFRFDLVCGEVVANTSTSSCACSSGAGFFGPATVNSTYDVNDDSYFELTFTNDVNTDCGAPFQTTYSFTKQ